MVASCDRKPLVQIRTERVTPPPALLSCPGDKPQPPSIDALSGSDGDNQLAIFIARLEAWGQGRENCLGDIRTWAQGTPPKP